MPTVVQQLCDLHYVHGETVEGFGVVLKIGALERVVILCEDHRAAIVGPVETLMREFGAKPAPVKPQPHTSSAGFGRMPLPEGMTREEALARVDAGVCVFDESHNGYTHRAGLSSHMRSQHGGASLTALGLGKRGTAIEHAPPSDLACDICEDRKVYRNRQGLATHKARKHGTYAETPTAKRHREVRESRKARADAVA